MKSHSLKWIMEQIRPRIPAILLLTVAHIGNALMGILFALGSRGIIDSAITGNNEFFLKACLCQLAIILGILVCMTAARLLKERLTADLEQDWKRKLLHGLLNGEYAKVSAYHSGELLNRLNNDVTKVDEGVLSIFPAFMAMVIRLIAAMLVLGILDGRFALLVMLLGFAVMAGTGAVRHSLKQLNKQVSEHDGSVSGFLQEAIEKLLMIQSMDVSGEVEHRLDRLLEQRYAVQRKRKNVGVMANTGVSVMYYGAGFFALVWCSVRMMQGTMSFGSLTAVIQLVNQLQKPFVEMSGVLPQYAAMVASGERLMELDEIQGEPGHMEETAEDIYRKMVSVCAEGLSFSYNRDQVFQSAEFELPKGAFAVITGQSGIGKSTLLKLLLGVFKPESGQLYLRSGDERILLDRSTRCMFSYAPQGNLLLSGTLRDNLTIVKPEATEEEILQAVYVSAMDEFLDQLPMGLQTRLGENAAGLSEGQAQRLTIARAVLSGAPILLLDECTSALDAKTEQTVLERLCKLPDRTCIAVTHRPAAEELCDWKLEIRDGKICSVRMNPESCSTEA